MDLRDKGENYGLGIGLCFGALIGFILGIIIDNILMGLSLCCVVGVVSGNIYDEIKLYKKGKEKIQD